jgi:outer membrane immunogenic protein
MKRLLLIGTAFAALIAGSAIAVAQQPRVYRRPVVAAPVYSWTGLYVGGNVGYSWGDARTDLAGAGRTVVPPFSAAFAFANTDTARVNGVIGGGQVGYNFQINPKWLLGLEADIQGSGQRGSGTFVDSISFQFSPVVLVQDTFLTGYEAKIDSFGTVRGRLGFLIGDQLLLYGTGGLAYGRVTVSGNTNLNGSLTLNGGIIPFNPNNPGFSASKTNVGFSVGGGIEGRVLSSLPGNWTWKLEYLYLDLGSLDIGWPFTSSPQLGAFIPPTGTIAMHTHFTDNIVRVGLNYKFGNYYTLH